MLDTCGLPSRPVPHFFSSCSPEWSQYRDERFARCSWSSGSRLAAFVAALVGRLVGSQFLIFFGNRSICRKPWPSVLLHGIVPALTFQLATF